MPRAARKRSSTWINHQNIFLEEDDFDEYLYRLKRISSKYYLEIYAYCLMGNHVHLLIKEGIEDISVSLKRLSVGYVQWYNKKYRRSGHLFQDRFLNEPVEDDVYLLTVSRYIHMNPVKAGIVERAEDWKWSSCKAYLSIERSDRVLKREQILEYFCTNQDNAINRYQEYMKEKNEDKCMEYKIARKSDDEVFKAVVKLMEGLPIHSLMSLEKSKRDKIIIKAKKIEGVTQRQLARVLGISPNLVFKAK